MSRILLVCGSLQRSSANRAALDVAGAALAQCGVEGDAFNALGELPPFSSDEVDAPPGAVIRWRRQIGAAGAVLIAAPEYAGGIAGVVKNALDWVVGSGEFYAKPVALLSAGTSGGVWARRDLVRTLSWQGAHVVHSLGIEGAQKKLQNYPDSGSAGHPDGRRRFVDPVVIGEIEALVQALVTAIGQPPSARLPAIERLALDAGIDPAPLAQQIRDIAGESKTGA